MEEIIFTKMHGAGNDFIIIDNRSSALALSRLPALARQLCDRRLSIGADGMMVVVPPTTDGDYGMLFYNSDGSLGEMCGNGARCIARYGYENGLAGQTQRIETTAGLVVGQRMDKRQYRVRLNDPGCMELNRLCPTELGDYVCSYVELGCPGIPHAVHIMDDWDEIPREELSRLGKALRHSSAFPKGANVSFVKLCARDEIKAITFERGVEDFTLACGTGSGATVSALSLMGLVSGKDVKVHMPGGTLSISLSITAGSVSDIFLTGPTCIVCRGKVLEENLIM